MADDLAEVTPLDVVPDEKRNAPVRARAERGDDVRVLDPTGGRDSLLQGPPVRGGRRQEFQDDDPATPEIMGFEDLALVVDPLQDRVGILQGTTLSRIADRHAGDSMRGSVDVPDPDGYGIGP